VYVEKKVLNKPGLEKSGMLFLQSSW